MIPAPTSDRAPVAAFARHAAVLAPTVIALAIAAIGCGKKVGGPCTGTASSCTDKQTALACHGGKLAAVTCGGPAGCANAANQASCDTSVASVGAPCMGDGEDEYACSPDKKRALVCKGAKFEPYLECRGAAGCAVLGKTVSCDTSIANRNDPCKSQGAVACSEDQKEMLVCRDGRFVSYRFCRGQFGCFVKNETPSCDETYSIEGDPCGLSGQVVCAVDHSAELVCQGGKFARSRRCKKGCTVTNRAGRPIECE